jgi:lipid II:glycine glycyltransferase (peptidoglycan interpeptide bridge formation enzyme)
MDGKRILVSHPGASYGGLVLAPDAGIREVDTIIVTLLSYAQKNGFQEIQMTLPPIIYHQQPSHYLDFSLFRHGFHYRKREVSSIISLKYSDDNILSTFRSESRTSVRKAIKSGVYIETSQDIADFYSILKTNLKMRHNVSPTHTLDELKRLTALMANDIQLFSAFLADQMIAGMMIFVCNSRVLLAFYISHLEKYQSYRPVNILMYEVIKWAVSQGFSYLDLGIFTVNMKPNWGLGRFKESFGAHGIFRDRFYIDL